VTLTRITLLINILFNNIEVYSKKNF